MTFSRFTFGPPAPGLRCSVLRRFARGERGGPGTLRLARRQAEEPRTADRLRTRHLARDRRERAPVLAVEPEARLGHGHAEVLALVGALDGRADRGQPRVPSSPSRGSLRTLRARPRLRTARALARALLHLGD